MQASLEQLGQQGQQSANRLESLRHLAGDIAHNFNNILTGVQGHAELQRRDDVSARQNTEYIDAQINGCRRAAEPVAVEVEVVADAVAAVDRKAVAQAVDSIVANAIEAMAGPRGNIVVRLLQASLTEPRLMSGSYRTKLPTGVYACIRVTDHGEGISAEEIEHILDPYHSRKQFGRGLGLASILGVAHGHGGIEVESRLGHGSTVSLYLPIMEASAPQSVTYSASV